MRIQHNCISVLDIDEAVKFYTEVMGFMLITPPEHVAITPYGKEAEAPESDFTITQAECGDLCFHIKNVECKMAVCLLDPMSPEGQCIEIQCYSNPKTTLVEQNYITTGIKEICFNVPTEADVYAWNDKLIAAGVKMQGPVWTIGSGTKQHKTVLFYDPSGNILQIAN